MKGKLVRGQKMCPDWHADYKKWVYGELKKTNGKYTIYSDSGEVTDVFPETVEVFYDDKVEQKGDSTL